MVSQPAYEIDSSPTEVVVRFKRDRMTDEQISRFLDYMELESIRHDSELTEEAAAELADEIDRAVWERNRHRVPGLR
jgi:hypothetical protein